MTNHLTLLARAALAVGAAFAIFACSPEEMPEVVVMPDQVGHDGQAGNDEGVRTIQFRALPLATKAQFGAEDNGCWPTLWTANDTELKLSLNYGGAQAAGVTPTQDGTGASFSAEVDFSGVSGPYTFYAVSPSSAAKALSPSREAWKVSIPCTQTPSAGSADEGAIIIAASSEEFASAAGIGEVDLPFGHLTAYGRMSLGNFTPGQGETVSAVELTVTTPFVGDWYWKCEPDPGDDRLIDYGASSTLTINTSSISDIWFGCAPVNVSGEILVVNVYTDAGVYKQETLFPDNCEFTAGQVAMFTVDMTGAGFTAAGSGSGGGGGGDVVVLSEEFDNSTTGDSSSEFSSSKFPNFSGAVSKAYTSKYGGVKLGSSSASGFITSKSLDLSNSFTVTLNLLKYGSDTGKVQVTVGSVTKEITPTDTDTAYSLDFDAATSASSVKIGTSTKRAYIDNVIITRHDGGSGSGSSADSMLQRTVYGGWLGTGKEWEFNPGTDQVTRCYDSNGVQTYTLINPSTVEELEISGYKKSYLKGDSFTVTVNWRRGATTVLQNAQYTVTLIKEDGPKVWLSDGAGKGFIIKK